MIAQSFDDMRVTMALAMVAYNHRISLHHVMQYSFNGFERAIIFISSVLLLFFCVLHFISFISCKWCQMKLMKCILSKNGFDLMV